MYDFQYGSLDEELKPNLNYSDRAQIVETGFLAQEVEQAAQETGYNFNGVHAPADPERDHYRMSYATFVVPLVKAVQEQQAIITDLQQQINDLRAMVNELQED